MTVTYVFRATNRMARGLQQSDASDGAVQSQSDTNQSPADTNVATLDRSTAPAARPSTPATAAPLILSDPVDKLRRSERPGATPAAKIVTPAIPVTAQLPATYVAAEGRIILVAKARGGIGATTLAVNLALEMQMAAMKRRGTIGGRIALVDLDVQLGNAGSFLDLADRGGMMALAQLAPEPDAQAVRHAMVQHTSGLGVLAAPTTAIPFDAFDIKRIGSMLDALVAENDVVVVDLPPALIDWLEPLLARAERLLMVTDLAVPSIVRARRIISLMTEDHPKLSVEIVVAHEKKPYRLGQSHRDAAAALGHPLRHWLPDEAKLARQALDRGEPLIQLAPRCGWSKAVKAMASELQTTPKTSGKATDRGDH